MSEWKPIETAPKDGKEVFLWGMCAMSDIDLRYAFDANVGWCDENGVWQTRVPGEICHPTHWMPIPKPPQRSAGDE